MRKILYCILTLILCCTSFVACAKETPSASSEPQQSASSTNNNSIEFVVNEITLTAGESVQAEVVTSKQNVFVFWSVRDEEIATVENGLITGVSEGQTICYASFGGVTAMCLVKVLSATAAPMLSVTTPYAAGVTLLVGDTFNPLISVKLGDSVIDNAQIEYVVDKTEVVDVEDGILVARSVGDAVVSVNVSYGEETASMSFAVSVVSLA